jgi:hypothetical protein
VSTIAAAVSLSVFGYVAQGIGNWAGFMGMAALAAAGALLLWFKLGETKPAEYID